MKVLYIHQYFVTPKEYGSTRSYWFAKKLIELGHTVTMITSTRDNSLRKPGRINIEGIEVVYIDSEYNNLMRPLAKVRSFVNFMLQAIWTGVKEKDVDLVFATSTPLSIGVIALCLKIIKGHRFIFEVRDLWPEFPIQIGAIKNKVIINLLRWLEKKIYKESLSIVALSPGMKEGVLQSGVAENKVEILPNMSKPDIFYPRPTDLDTVEKFDIDLKKFNVVHFGSMGEANGLEYIVEAARYLQGEGDDSIVFYMVGYGQTESKLRALVDAYGLQNVKFLGKHSSIVTSEIVNCCDATVTTFKTLPILETNSPNKFFDSLSAGKPLIVNIKGWIKDLVEQHECGFYVDGLSPEALAKKLLEIKINDAGLDLWGRNARSLSLKEFDKEIISTKFACIVERYGK